MRIKSIKECGLEHTWDFTVKESECYPLSNGCISHNSSSSLSGSPNGLYPVRSKIVTKASRKGKVQFICQSFVEGKHKPAWDIDNITLSKYYARVQDFTDQAISCDFYVVPLRFEGGKVPMSQLIKEWVIHAKLGNKTRYYLNTKDSNGGTIQDQIVPEEIQEDDGCSSCKL
jgi:ribonucleoside-diphosphate reductase alpha chain